MYNDRSNDGELGAVGQHQGRAHEQRRVVPVFFLVEEAFGCDNSGDVVGEAIAIPRVRR